MQKNCQNIFKLYPKELVIETKVEQKCVNKI